MKKLKVFTDKYAKQLPQLHKIEKLIHDLKDGEYFIVLPAKPDNVEFYNWVFSFLRQKNTTGKVDSSTIETEISQVNELFGELRNTYNIIPHKYEKRTYIGEADKSKRICRFCKNQREIVTFENKAHAISEALGNKNIILREECDVCNEYFDKNIERDFIKFVDLFRGIYGAKGKKGTLKIKYKNATIENKGDKIDFFYLIIYY